MEQSNKADSVESKDRQFEFTVDEIITETESTERLTDTTICKIKQRFVDVDSKKKYYRIEVLNVNQYVDHYWLAETVESDYKTKETWSSEEIQEWENEDWGICPAFEVNHQPERQPILEDGS